MGRGGQDADDGGGPSSSVMNSRRKSSKVIEELESDYDDDDTSQKGGGSEEKDDDVEKKEKSPVSLTTKLWNIAAAVTILAWLLAFAFFFDETVVLVAGGIGIVVSLWIVKTSFQLEEMQSLRDTQNEIRRRINEFATENDKLTSSNDRLADQIGPLKDSEKKLKKICKKNGTSIKKLQKLVSKDKQTTEQMQRLVKEDVTYQMINIVLEADKDEGGDLSDKEINVLVNRLSALPALTVNKPLLIKKVKKDRTVNAVVALMRTIHDEDIPEKRRPFKINEDLDINDLFTDD